jgi:hypothetical protein
VRAVDPKVRWQFRCPLWSLAEIRLKKRDVRFTPESGHSSLRIKCPLCANSGHSQLHNRKAAIAAAFLYGRTSNGTLRPTSWRKSSNLTAVTAIGRAVIVVAAIDRDPYIRLYFINARFTAPM